MSDYVIPFGKKYKGKKISDVPREELEDYIAWLENNSKNPNDPQLAELKAAFEAPRQAVVVESPVPKAMTVRQESAIQSAQDFPSEKLALIKKTFGHGLTDQEFQLYISVAKARNLDPLLNQIHAVKRSGKMVVQIGIDGFRLIASRTGEYAGRDEAQFEYDEKKLPTKAKITVYRFVNGERCAFTATARWSEYCPQGNQDFMWKKMPETMLEKVCEAKALRMAFPGEMSGLYSHEEMHQAERVSPSEMPSVSDYDGPMIAVEIDRKDLETRDHLKGLGFVWNWEMSRWTRAFTDGFDLGSIGVEFEIIETPAALGG